jgi:hypothetical protein
MAILKKVIMLAITSGLAKKAWNAYRTKSPMAAGRARSDVKNAGRSFSTRNRDRPGSY